ncbi:MAG: Xaa-Pro aminopeptidase, partial [Myxococcota bacterium]|nr:Xaa-Pro aminopeptidase [Myxococcota bacterium]
MLTPEFHADRRRRLIEAVGGPVLLVGNGRRTRNLPMSDLPFRQDSSFLYFTGCHTPGAACLLGSAGACLFLPEPAEDDALWHGSVPSLGEQAGELGFDTVYPVSRLDELCSGESGLVALAASDPASTARASRITGESLSFGDRNGHPDLVEAVIRMRRLRSTEELDQMRAAAVVTERAHRAAMSVTHPGHHERQVTAAFHAVIEAAGLCTAYPSIVTVR